MEIPVVRIEERFIEGFHQCLDRVARERLFLSFLEGPSLENVREFVLGNIRDDHAQYFAVDGDKVVGWCDITPSERPSMAHTGILGMGMDEPYRGKGLGGRLMKACLDHARGKGLEKVELTVIASNGNAIRLYERMGFKEEGRLGRKMKIDGRYEDLIAMYLFLD